MFCPKCGAEYREGFTQCADCGVPLVWDEPVKAGDQGEAFVEYVEILRTFNPADLAIIRSLLTDAGIDYFVKDEHLALVRPLVEPPAVMVSRDQVQEAVDIIKDLKLEYKAISGFGRASKDDEDEVSG
jgi:hypothetical protein